MMELDIDLDRRQMPQGDHQDGDMGEGGTAAITTEPIASTSRLPPSPGIIQSPARSTRSPISDPVIDVVDLPLSATGGGNQDSLIQDEELEHLFTVSRSITPPAPPLSSSSLQGKERAVHDDDPPIPSISGSSSFPDHHSKQSIYALSSNYSYKDINSIWQQSEIDRLRIEKQSLERQLQVLALKTLRKPSHLSQFPDETTVNSNTSQELCHLRQKLQSSEAERHRLKEELKSLRLFLLSGVQLTTTTTTTRQNTNTSRTSHHPRPRHSHQEDSYDYNDGSINDDILFEEAELALSDSLKIAGRRQRRRRAMMGDAETEHLLLAAAQIGKINRTLDFRTQDLSLSSPSSSSSSTSPLVSTSNTTFRRSKRRRTLRQHQSSTAESILPPLPPTTTFNDDDFDEEDAEHELDDEQVNESAYLGSPMRTASSVKLEINSPRIGANSYATFFGGSSSHLQGQSTQSTQVRTQARAPNMAQSSSAEAREREGRKIGRPLGSPNKTKLVPIQDTNASRRRMRASAYATSNGGKGRGRGRPLSSSSPGRYLNDSDLLPITSQSQSQYHGDIDPELYAAVGAGVANLDDQEDEEDMDWPESIQQEIDGESYSPPLYGPYAPKDASKLKSGVASRSTIVGFPPATPASLEGPDMTRFPNRPTLPFLPPSGSIDYNSMDLPPTTPGQSSSSILQQPPQTPNTLQKERSALDLLAEEAASASKGASGNHTREVHIASGSGRNLAQELDFVSSRDFGGSGSGTGALSYEPGQIFSADYPASNSQYRQYDQSSSSLGEPFRPDDNAVLGNSVLQSNIDNDAASYDRETSSMPSEHKILYRPRTIAEQLARGVDVSHPLIDPEDLEAGMTPAAALAKKSRSPYVKWTVEEDESLIKGVAEFGTKWESVARRIPSRSYHQCRQRWLRGLRSGEALPSNMEYLRPQIEVAIQAYEQTRVTKKPEPV